MTITLASAPFPIATSTNGGSTWTVNNQKTLRFKLGWNKHNAYGEYSDDTSIASYGKHSKRFSEELITSDTDALNYAVGIVEAYKSPKYSGVLTIYGQTGLDITKYITLNLPSYGINEEVDLISYTHIFDRKGFRTKIAFGYPPYDIAAKVAKLERDVYGS